MPKNHSTKGKPRAPTKALPSVEYLCARLDYDLETKQLYWKSRPLEDFPNLRLWASWNARWPKTVAGIVNSAGYVVVKIDKVAYKAQRIIYKMTTGEEPPEIIDHADIDQLNNAATNLRAATPSQSTFNQGLRSDNTSGVRGVFKRGKRWVVHIRKDGTRYNLGTFDTREEAIAARKAAAHRLFGEFYRE